MPRPNFFIVGAPRCGTTAMYQYLRAHPDIYMAKYNEPHFFGSDLVGRNFEVFRGRLDAYLALFDGATGQRRIGERSTRYLCSTRAAAEIHDFEPDARIIIMLRSPVDMMYSIYYHQRMYSGTENAPTFEQALALEPERKAGRHIPKGFRTVNGLLYRETASFAGQVRRYFDVFGRDQVHVIIFDDVKVETEAVYRHVLDFLEVDSTFRPDLGVVHDSRQSRSMAVRNLIRNPLFVTGGRRFPTLTAPLYKALMRLNSRPFKRPPLDVELRQRLQADLLPEVEQLSALLGRDLTHWCRE